jgi:hypothetical protein
VENNLIMGLLSSLQISPLTDSNVMIPDGSLSKGPVAPFLGLTVPVGMSPDPEQPSNKQTGIKHKIVLIIVTFLGFFEIINQGYTDLCHFFRNPMIPKDIKRAVTVPAAAGKGPFWVRPPLIPTHIRACWNSHQGPFVFYPSSGVTPNSETGSVS